MIYFNVTFFFAILYKNYLDTTKTIPKLEGQGYDYDYNTIYM